MRLYFLVEGVTERKLYPAWIEYLVPSLTRISAPQDPRQNGYYLITGGGFPGLLDNHLENSLADINAAGDYDYFVMALDADELTVPERIDEVNQRLSRPGVVLPNCEIRIAVQNRCVETWLLGNRRVFSRSPTSPDLIGCVRFYDVLNEDPELMERPEDFKGTTAEFHYKYLRDMLAERKVKYSKTRPGGALTRQYLDRLLQRIEESPQHLSTLQSVVGFFQAVQASGKP
jgi:hypothetical protein